jgi:phage nucleotide-binding protein
MFGFIDLENLQPNRVSSDFASYSMLLYAPPGFGKTTELNELYKGRALFLAHEKGYKLIPGISAAPVGSYAGLLDIVMQLETNENLKEKWDVVVIDTVDKFAGLCERTILKDKNKEWLGDAGAHGKAYKILDFKFEDIVKRIQDAGYGVVYISHAKEVEETDKDTGQKYKKFVPSLPDRLLKAITGEVDFVFFGYKQGEDRYIGTRDNKYFFAKSRMGKYVSLPAKIEFSADKLQEEFDNAIKKLNSKTEFVTTERIKQSITDDKFDYITLKQEVTDLCKVLTEEGKGQVAKSLVEKILGVDENGVQITIGKLAPHQAETLAILKMELNKLK